MAVKKLRRMQQQQQQQQRDKDSVCVKDSTRVQMPASTHNVSYRAGFTSNLVFIPQSQSVQGRLFFRAVTAKQQTLSADQGSISPTFYGHLLRQQFYTNPTGLRRKSIRVERILQPYVLVNMGVFLLVKLNGACTLRQKVGEIYPRSLTTMFLNRRNASRFRDLETIWPGFENIYETFDLQISP